MGKARKVSASVVLMSQGSQMENKSHISEQDHGRCDRAVVEGRGSGFVTSGNWRGPWERVLRRASPGRVVLCDLSYPPGGHTQDVHG